ncbi:hypothetical protein Kpol_1061p3 [Vanderwaltozyma polyspora DSM 70294]|uniref:DNA-binding protein REB1 n=1 Tax=Vanderwaltozyma polyspora (strain ATCC 22028 / DSM 70294 / BCRC 21397 / CBS 2163 / NBRC 10782 / NRRL Y-8283 / UCD 57-17) TaxID=436907 RepID=A7TJD1_VANPO|nr:uncharacterized protein Kpol_1061p3 [Vanderwaltozyma polyspora DSM 70294]EDO17581.1 hypothetical protein Kpol_1061p3 [Vanderwaltozyma polyspora DSM 70294]
MARGANKTRYNDENAHQRQESVEEAVFKYVGVGLRDNDDEVRSQQDLKEQEEEHEHQKERQQEQEEEEAEDDAKVKDGDENEKSKNTANGDDDNDGENRENDNNENENKSDRRNSTTADAAVAAVEEEMQWLLQHADINNSQNNQQTSDGNDPTSREPHAVAIAAVANALAAAHNNRSQKRSYRLANRENEEPINGENRGKEDKHNDGAKNAKKNKETRFHDNNTSKNINDRPSKKSKVIKDKKNEVAVDPELATLDDDTENHDHHDVDVSEHDQLVRKAIIDSDSITQHPDFQQYLNTDDDYKESKLAKRMLHEAEQVASAEDNAKTYADLQKSANLDENNETENGENRQAQKAEFRELLPKVHNTNNRALVIDVSHLVQSAATKASASIVATTSQASGKSFDAAEEAALEQFINEYQKIKDLSRKEICQRIWSNERRKDDFWVNICKVLPYRTRSSIYKHVRRKYHIFEQRGKWTPQEESELARLCVEKEGQWSEIGKALGRMPEDCRDRWRNYVKCGDKRSSHKWTTEEEELLKKVISEMLSEAEIANNENESYDRKDEFDDITDMSKKEERHKTFKDIINWTIVSERMGGKRSRIQCRYKWNKLMKKQAMDKIETITDNDKKWILGKLRDLGFTEDSQVDWDDLAMLKVTGLSLSGAELKLCYEKMRGKIKNAKSKTINEISKELLTTFDA